MFKRKAGLFTIFMIVFIGLLGFGIFIPLLPYYAKTLNASPFVNGLLTASYAAAQFVATPMLGRASDRFGRRPLLLISIAGTVIAFIILGFANTLWILFFARMLDGFTGGNISVAQAYITDITDSRSRSKGLGLIGAAFGLGFIFGPALGGFLSQYGYNVPAFVAAGMSLISFLGVVFFLPESLSKEARAELAKKARQEFTLRNLWAALNRPLLGSLLHIRFFFGLASSTFQTIFPLYASQYLGFTAAQTGYILAYVGVLAVLVQGVGISWLTKRFSDYRLIFWSTVIFCVALFIWALPINLPVLLVILAPLALATGILNTLLGSVLTKSVPPEEIGGSLGLSAALESLTRVISPSAGGLLLGSLGAWAPGFFSGVIMAWTVTYTWRHLIHKPEQPPFIQYPVNS
jgi:MFS transporter, DHA1 family, tetracycline resistance protein